jgi:ferritin-like metal-binding protein YciE
MAESVKDVMVTGLRNAHAMEEQAVQLLQRQSERLGDYPQLQARVQQHLQETRQQQELLEGVLGRFNAGTSSVKQAALGLVANLQAMTHAVAEDEVLKNSMASYAFEHFEMAAYKSLITMARQCGEAEVERVCSEILRQEESMAGWLGDHLDEVTRDYLRVQGHA